MNNLFGALRLPLLEPYFTARFILVSLLVVTMSCKKPLSVTHVALSLKASSPSNENESESRTQRVRDEKVDRVRKTLHVLEGDVAKAQVAVPCNQ